MDYKLLAERRVDSFDRMLFAMRQIISNCMFQIDKDDKLKANVLVERLDLVEMVSEHISTRTYNLVTKENELVINEAHFRKCLDVLSNIKQELNFILNKAGLIFRKGEEINVDDFMKSVYEG